MPSNGWLEPNICNIAGIVINKVQQARCPLCRKPLTVPYRPNGFKDYQFCPFCGKRVNGKKTAIEVAAEIIKTTKCPMDFKLKNVVCNEECRTENRPKCWDMEAVDGD